MKGVTAWQRPPGGEGSFLGRGKGDAEAPQTEGNSEDQYPTVKENNFSLCLKGEGTPVGQLLQCASPVVIWPSGFPLGCCMGSYLLEHINYR